MVFFKEISILHVISPFLCVEVLLHTPYKTFFFRNSFQNFLLFLFLDSRAFNLIKQIKGPSEELISKGHKFSRNTLTFDKKRVLSIYIYRYYILTAMNILNISMLHILNICTCTHKKKVGSQEKVTSATISKERRRICFCYDDDDTIYDRGEKKVKCRSYLHDFSRTGCQSTCCFDISIGSILGPALLH